MRKLLTSIFQKNDFQALTEDEELHKQLTDQEAVEASFKLAYGYVAVTGRRLIVAHKVGVSGYKNYMSIPFGRIGYFSVNPKAGFSLGGSGELRITIPGVADDVILEFSDNDNLYAFQRGLAALAFPAINNI